MGLSREDIRRIDAAEERAERQRNKAKSREPELEVVASKSDRPAARSKVNYDSLEQAFPAADPALEPFGSNVLVQLRTPKLQSDGGILLVDETRAIDSDNTQIAKIIKLGPLAFHNRETLQPWPEGAWVKPGDYVRVPKYGGDRWLRDAPGSVDGKCVFILYNDLDLMGRVPEEHVLGIIAYI
jgi:co-chaperonin GroES (HSP10)